MRQRPRLGLLAALVTLFGLVLQPAPALAEESTNTASISGHVTSVNGTDLPGIRVVAYRDSGSGKWRGEGLTLTDAGGRFEITGLPAGSYSMSYVPPAKDVHLAQYANTTEPFDLAEGEAAPGHDAQLLIGGSISGQVTGENGEPLANARVDVMRGGWYDNQTYYTDAEGRYQAVGLVQGGYFIRFQPPADAVLHEEWWPNSNEGDREAVSVTVGHSITGIDAALQAGFSVSGSVWAEGSSPEGVVVSLWWYPEPGAKGILAARATVNAAYRSYSFRDLRPGEYRLQFEPPKPNWYLLSTVWWPNSPDEAGATSFVLGDRLHVDEMSVTIRRHTDVTNTVTGVPVVGHTLRAQWSVSNPDANPVGTYRWLRNGTAIPGATGESYRLVAADVGTRISGELSVTAYGFVPQTVVSKATERIAAGAVTALSKPAIGGNAIAGRALTVVPGTYSPAGTTTSHKWLRDGVVLGRSSNSYPLSIDDVGRSFGLEVTVTKPNYLPATYRISSPPVCASASTVPPPSVPGSRLVGRTLTGTHGAWPSSVAVGYQWTADNVPIEGATKPTFKLTSAHQGKRIRLTLVGTMPGCKTVFRHSPETVRVGLAGTPKISGTAKVGKTLKVKVGDWTSHTKFSYRWYANDKPIGKATRSSLKLTKAHKGKRITVRVIGTKTGYGTVAKTSSATAKVR